MSDVDAGVQELWALLDAFPVANGADAEIFMRRVRSIGIRGRPTSHRAPWQNAYAERLIGSIRWEFIDHIVVVGERHLRHVLLSYMGKRHAHSPVIEQGRADIARRRKRGTHYLSSDPGRDCTINMAGCDFTVGTGQSGHALPALQPPVCARSSPSQAGKIGAWDAAPSLHCDSWCTDVAKYTEEDAHAATRIWRASDCSM